MNKDSGRPGGSDEREAPVPKVMFNKRAYEPPAPVVVSAVDEEGLANWDFPVPWGLRHVFWVIVLVNLSTWYLGKSVPPYILPVSQSLEGFLSSAEGIFRLMVFISVTPMMVYGAVFLWIRDGLNQHGIPWRRFLGKTPSVKIMFLSALLGCSLGFFAVYATLPTHQSRPVSLPLLRMAIVFCTLVLSVGVVGPVVEELFFRGIGYRLLRIRLGPARATVIVSLLFVLYHPQIWGDFSRGLVVFLSGLVITVLYEKTCSVVPCLATHFFANLIAILGTIWVGNPVLSIV